MEVWSWTSLWPEFQDRWWTEWREGSVDRFGDGWVFLFQVSKFISISISREDWSLNDRCLVGGRSLACGDARRWSETPLVDVHVHAMICAWVKSGMVAVERSGFSRVLVEWCSKHLGCWLEVFWWSLEYFYVLPGFFQKPVSINLNLNLKTVKKHLKQELKSSFKLWSQD